MGGVMQYVRDTYRVPAKRGMRVQHVGADNEVREGVIVRARSSARLAVRLDGETIIRIYHPMDLVYLTEAHRG